MSLGKLLSTGRSLIGGAPHSGRYDISNCNNLPKFNAATNPFAQPSKPAEPVPVAPAPAPAPELAPEPVAPPQVDAAAAADVLAPTQPKKTQLIEYKKTQRLPQVAGPSFMDTAILKSKAVAQAASTFCRASFAKLSGLTRKVSGLFRRKEPATVFPRLGKPAVQTLLSLDNVRVIRNSLEDSDLEIVTTRTATSTQVAPTTPVASPKRGPVPAALKKLSARLMSLKKQD
jgi:hypothetical protein